MQAINCDAVVLVSKIQHGAPDGMEELYGLVRSIGFWVAHRVGSRDVDDKIHDAFLAVVQAICRNKLRDPRCLMGFVRTIVRRQLAAQIAGLVRDRELQTELNCAIMADRRPNPEQSAILHQRNDLIRVLADLSDRDREILTRFYVQDQAQDQICEEMDLTRTQFRLSKSRAKARFVQLAREELMVHRRRR